MCNFKFDKGDKSAVETANAAASFATLNSNYSAFQDGATYSYTDGYKVTDYKNQADGDGTDITTVTIDRTIQHGTKQNPYVIDSYAKWKTFAQDNGMSHSSDTSYQFGYGKVWVLAVDITFNTTTQPFLPVWGFGGEFYGLGHTLSNIDYNMANLLSNWNTTESGMGIFCNTYTGNQSMPNPTVIADLNVDNYKFTNCPITVGAIVGRCYSSSTCVLNCHAKGTLDRSNAINKGTIWGGIIGTELNSDNVPGTAGWFSKDIAIYRCSSQTLMNIQESTSNQNLGVYVGGILGSPWLGNNTYIWDCYAETTLIASGFVAHFTGGIIGTLPSSNWNSLGGTYQIKDCVSIMTYNFNGWGTAANNFSSRAAISSVFSIQGGTDPDGDTRREHGTYGNWIGNTYLPSAVNITVSNTYSVNAFNFSDVSGNSYLGSGERFSYCYPLWTGYQNEKSWYDSYTTINSSNNFYSCNNKYTTASVVDTTEVGVFSTGNGSTFLSLESDLYTKAKNDTVNGNATLKSKIWENKANIGGTYSVATSPVRNSKISPTYKVEYFNLKTDGSDIIEEPISGVNNRTYTYGQMTTLSLTAASNYTGREFKGWTTDITGNSAPINSVNMQGMNGNLKFYAVWDVTDTTASLSTLNNITEAERGSAIYLQATVTTPTITDPEITYKFLKDGTVVSTATGTENNEYVIDTIEQNGLYSLDYIVSDSEYPLMRHSGGGTNSLQLEITKKSTSIKRFTPSTATPAYIGAPLSAVNFDLVMEDNGAEVAGTATWQYPTVPITAGTNKATIVFKPTDSNTYKDMTVEVEFDATPLTLTFHIPDIDDFVVNIDYAQDYSADQIVKMFEDAFNAKIAADSTFEASVANRTPKLGGVEITKYTANFTGATTPQTINISFTDAKTYDVLLDYAFDSKKEVLKSYWNKLIPAPKTPNRGENWVLVGWFVTDSEGNVSETEKWDFDNDRVTENITLTAKWVKDVLHLDSISVSANKTTFTALTTLDKLGLTVTATYHSELDPDTPITKNIPFKTGDGDGYEVRVDGAPANELHVGDNTIEIWYDGELYETLNITVNPVKLNSSSIHFPACTKDEIVGVAQEIDPLSTDSLPVGIREWVLNIEISYYSDSACTQPVSEVVAQGTYYAQANFIMRDDDHELAPVKTRFVISKPRTPVTVSWSSASGYTYDGTPQKPTATLTYDGGTVSASQFTYVILDSHNGVSTGIDADTYTISVVFTEAGETVYKFDAGAVTSMRYTIAKAKVAKPVASISSFQYGVENRFVLNGFDDSFMSYSSDSKLSGTDVGAYIVRVQLDGNHEWTEGGTVETYTWNIEPQKIARPTFDDVSIEYNSLEQSIVGELYGFDEDKMVITGDKGKNAGSYTARVTPSSNYTWDNANTPVTVSWTITKRTLYIVWEDEDTFEKEGTKRFSPKIVGFDGLAPEDKFNPNSDASSVKYSGDTNKSAVGAYVVKFASLNTSWASNYEIAEDLGKGYRIIAEGADPDDPNNPQVPDPANPNGGTENNGNGGKGGTTGENPSDGTIASYLPIILSGISLVLIVIFTVMTLNYNSAAKNAMAKTKQLAQVSYSFAPAGLLALALGLSTSNWWIIAGVLMGLALIMGIVAFTFRGKKQKALALLAEEEKRVAEEKELAKEEKAREEQQRRDNEMRMMFASMQQNYQQPQPQLQMDDIRGLLAETVSALLPAMQQQMALPPASFDVNASISAEAQKEIDGLHAQMAQQQALLNQILQNQQAQQEALAEALYEEPEPVDDTSWLGSDEVISLEESYGALSDDGKRFYYEVGSYIMNKPRTSQNDGRYAVLFKYRGKTIFKLAIKNDAPVLYYPAGGGRNEVRVADTSALELAKSVIDRQTVLVDNELN